MGAAASAVRGESAFTSAACDLAQRVFRIAEGVDHFPGILYDKDLFARGEEMVETFEPIGDDRRAASGGFEKAAGGTVSALGHAVAREVQGELGTGVERGMIAGRNMLDAANVGSPRPVPGVEGSGENEIILRKLAGGLKEKLVEFVLAIASIGAHVAQEAAEVVANGNSRVDIGINTSIER